jgi:hypothetical protein
MINSIRAEEGAMVNIAEHDGAGSRQREVVLLDDHEVLVDGHLLVVVEDISHCAIV